MDKQFYIDMANKRVSDFIGDERKEGNMNEYVRLAELAKVPGIGKKTMERIRETCEIHRFEQLDKKNKDLSKWLDDIFEGI